MEGGKSWNCAYPESKSLQALMESKLDTNVITHKGGCHCKRVRWKVEAPKSLIAWNCNYSTCSMRGNIHFIVPSNQFHLVSGESNITTYTFGTHTAKHTFCNVCGITSFYTPRSNPDGVTVTLACVDPRTLTHVEIRRWWWLDESREMMMLQIEIYDFGGLNLEFFWKSGVRKRDEGRDK